MVQEDSEQLYWSEGQQYLQRLLSRQSREDLLVRGSDMQEPRVLHYG
jgi:hypothetical protein